MPLVDPNYYSDEKDMQTMLEIVKETIGILESPQFLEFSELNKPIAESCKPCTNNTYDCDSYLRCLIGTGGTYGHPVGSCRMGSATDNNAVVDQRLRVRNISGLRVIDVSIMPEITSSGTNAPSIMIGERGAQFIIEDNSLLEEDTGSGATYLLYSYILYVTSCFISLMFCMSFFHI
jgi:choline dehydrogenase